MNGSAKVFAEAELQQKGGESDGRQDHQRKGARKRGASGVKDDDRECNQE